MIEQNLLKKPAFSLAQKLSDYKQLGKLRLSLVVVLSAAMVFLIAAPLPLAWPAFVWLVCGGLLITLGANSINEILEIRYDLYMARTASRPLPGQRMRVAEAWGFALLTTALGTGLLWVALGMLPALLGLASVLLYAFVYTPAKRMGPVAVFVGAIPGALPALIGWVAATGGLGAGGWVLFAIQVVWQLPHFWSIAWLAHEDYSRAGFRLMLYGAPGRKAAMNVLLLTALLVPMSLLPLVYGMAGLGATVLISGFSALYTLQALNLLLRQSRAAALGLMFGSFFYLPLVHLVLLVDKFI
ncbi:MAG: heme o synthase [Bacteroidetes bacterium]|nr:heme o synthase [Bacteroidota bacterium]